MRPVQAQVQVVALGELVEQAMQVPADTGAAPPQRRDIDGDGQPGGPAANDNRRAERPQPAAGGHDPHWVKAPERQADGDQTPADRVQHRLHHRAERRRHQPQAPLVREKTVHSADCVDYFVGACILCN